MNTFFLIVVVMVINISIQKICRDFVNELFITKMFSAKRTLIFSAFVKAYKFVKIKSKKR